LWVCLETAGGHEEKETTWIWHKDAVVVVLRNEGGNMRRGMCCGEWRKMCP
jgi:hypothetical protein